MEAQHKGRVRDDGRAENSWVQNAAKSCVSLPLPLFSLEDMGGREGNTPFSAATLCLPGLTFPLNVLKPPCHFVPGYNKTVRFLHIANTIAKKVCVPTTGLHADF